MPRKVLKNTPKTKAYLDSLPKVYAIFLWAKWGITEVPWSGKFNKDYMPLVYKYYDCNGACDEYHLTAVNNISSGAFYNWYSDKDYAEAARANLNERYGFNE